ncbi:helix-turn-helix domain-containing protein [Oceanicoccus sp. KOV_DT_Chl]|uniref:winged helix-turn-helix transcriptional regulator n=1 Tax=Oceanicoccus sp. KOV_DT_Chl TaxID=1904639 RepID=UPI000C7BD9ED|nr:helix-turn-helix domain-containing protein [Oceanicoccus sp. KOV_DT_Chl]
MNTPGSLCPAVKAADIVGDKWTLLILRELFFGACRYNEFQRAMPRISPTILSKRLKHLEQHGLVIRKSAAQRSVEYHLTACGRELAPVIDGLARWGLRWARDQLCDSDLDAGTFMWDFHRTLNVAELPDGDSVFSIILNDQSGQKQWWLIANGGVVDLCDSDTGREVDLYISSTLPDLAAVWMGDSGVGAAINNKTLMLTGTPYLIKTAERWFPKSIYADVRPENKI